MTHPQTCNHSISRLERSEQEVPTARVSSQGLRVLFILGEFPGVSETFVLDQITGLIDRGGQVAVLARRPRAPAPEHGAVAEYDLRKRTHYYPDTWSARWRARSELGSWFGSAPRHALGALARSLRLDLYGLDSLALGPLQRAATARALGPVDVIIAHFGPNGLKALQLRELGITRAPIVTFFHGHDLSRWTQRHGPSGYLRLFAQGERMLSISEHGRTKLVELGCPPDKVAVHRVGVDISSLLRSPPESSDARPAVFRLLSVGRLVEKKGFEFALRAVRLALVQHPDLQYDLIGDGPLRAPLEALAARLGVADRVRFHGQLAREAVESIRRQAHLVLVPSVTATDGDEEGIPVVLMEAMIAGVPVIATRHGGIPELVIDGETGLLVPERDSQALAAALTRMISDQPLRASLVRGAREQVVAQHDLTHQNDELFRLISCVARRRRESDTP